MEDSTKDKLIVIAIIIAMGAFFVGAYIGYKELEKMTINIHNTEINIEEQISVSDEEVVSNETDAVKEEIPVISNNKNKIEEKVEGKIPEKLIKVEVKAPEVKQEEDKVIVQKEELPEQPANKEPIEDKKEEEPQKDIIDFVVQDSNGNEVKLSDMKGKKVIVNFWATWCTYCIKEMPDFEKAYIANKEDICFMMINCDSGNKVAEKVENFLNKNEYSFPIYFDIMRDAVIKYNVTAFPTTLTFDEEGNLVKKHIGMLSEAKLKNLINELNKVEEE